MNTAQMRKISRQTPRSGVEEGIIIMWAGTPESIPEGWHICDGSDGTPDLRGRFLFGAGTINGSAWDVGLSRDNTISTHTHTMDSVGLHNHTVPSDGQHPAQEEAYTGSMVNNNYYTTFEYIARTPVFEDHDYYNFGNSQNTNHTHAIDSNSHTHVLEAEEVEEPLYRTLYFIIRVGR